MNETVRGRYERFPYPPVSPFALPRKGQGAALAFEHGLRLASEPPRSHAGIRILVAGCGTFEPLVVAQAHPAAREIVAMDLSETSIRKLRKRIGLARLAGVAQLRSRLAPVRAVRGDILAWDEQGLTKFDYIIASNVLHHCPDPAEMLEILARQLAPGGIMRVVTYPKASRIWMRETSGWLRANGLEAGAPGLRKKACEAIRCLPEEHPARSCYESQQETGSEAGLVDAFLHPCENPLSPLEWKSACSRAGLALFAEGQTETSRSSFLTELVPATAGMGAWERLQVLDDLLEICGNPVLWLKHGRTDEADPAAPALPGSPVPDPLRFARRILESEAPLLLASRVRFELGTNLSRAQTLLERNGVRLEDVIRVLSEQVGPRVSEPSRRQRVLRGLSITEYDSGELRGAHSPLRDEDWAALEAALTEARGPGWSVVPTSKAGLPRGNSLAEQARWIQILHGPMEPWIPITLRKRERPEIR